MQAAREDGKYQLCECVLCRSLTGERLFNLTTGVIEVATDQTLREKTPGPRWYTNPLIPVLSFGGGEKTK